MAILFDWYENPQSSEQQGEENALHPRLRLNGKMSTAQLRARIQKRCTLTETDVIAVLDALSHAMGEELADGKQVHLDGIGFFRPNLVSTEPVTEKTKYKNTKVKLKGIVYRSDSRRQTSFSSLLRRPTTAPSITFSGFPAILGSLAICAIRISFS